MPFSPLEVTATLLGFCFSADAVLQAQTCDNVSLIEHANVPELNALDDLWHYSIEEMVVDALTGASLKLFRDYITAEAAKSIHIKHLRLEFFGSNEDKEKFVEEFEVSRQTR